MRQILLDMGTLGLGAQDANYVRAHARHNLQDVTLNPLRIAHLTVHYHHHRVSLPYVASITQNTIE